MNFKIITNKKISLILNILVSVLLLGITLAKIDFKNSLYILYETRIFPLILVAAIINLDRLLMAYKWGILISANNGKVPFSPLLKSYYLSSFFGTILSNTIGEDIIRGLATRESGLNYEKIFSSILIERALAFLSIVVLSLVTMSMFLVIEKSQLLYLIMYILILFLILLLSIIISLNARFAEHISNNRFLKRKGKLWKFISKLAKSYIKYNSCKAKLILFFFLSIIENSTSILTIWLICKSLSLDVSILGMIYSVPTMTLISRLPISFGGIGLQEGAFVIFLSIAGITSSAAFSISILARIVSLLAILPIFFYFVFKNKRNPFNYAAEEESLKMKNIGGYL